MDGKVCYFDNVKYLEIREGFRSGTDRLFIQPNSRPRHRRDFLLDSTVAKTHS